MRNYYLVRPICHYSHLRSDMTLEGSQRVSRMSVYRLIHGGELEAVQFGRSFRVSQEALDAYLKKAFYQTG